MTKTNIITFFFSVYKHTLSPILATFFVGGCKFYPTCSVYARDSILKHGIVAGITLSVKRILRCHPHNKDYFFDPVPEAI